MPEKRKPYSDYPTILQQAIEAASKEAPDLAPVEMYGTFSKLLQPNASGYASPGGTIYVNQDKFTDLTDLIDTLIHENTHVRQRAARGGSTLKELGRLIAGGDDLPYGQRPDEMEAFQTAQTWRVKNGLQAGPRPSFTGGPDYIPADVNLPVMRKK